MTLTRRLSLVWLLVLAGTLLAFVVSVWLLMDGLWSLELKGRLHTVANSLVASMEIEPDGVEWNPAEHALDALQSSSELTVGWLVAVPGGPDIEASPTPLPSNLREWSRHAVSALQIQQVRLDREEWDVLVRDVRYEAGQVIAPDSISADPEPDDTPEYPVIRLTAAISRSLLLRRRQHLGIGLGTMAGVIWLASAAGANWMCRRALQPLSEMTRAAEAINFQQRDQRLPTSTQDDELSELAQAFNGLLQRLETALTQERRFASSASHQLRTPLTVLRGEIDLALRRERSAEEYRAVLSRAGEQTQHLTDIVEVLLWLARADAQWSTDGVQVTDLREWLQQWSARSPFACEIVTPPVPAPAAIHSLLLEQALDNLVDNARRYGTTDSAPRVLLTLGPEQITLAVENQGPPITADELQHIFEPFVRGSSCQPGAATGTGLGLAIVRQIVNWHRGSLDVTSSHETGTRFTIALPRESASPA